MEEERIYYISLGEIRISEENVRDPRHIRDLDELADGIEAVGGLLHPVELSGEYGHPPYDLVVGQRRFRAHQDILAKRNPQKWGKIRAMFVEKLDKLQRSLRSLAENMHRSQLDDADAMAAVTDLYKHYGRDEHKVKAATGLSIQRIRKYVYIQERASEKMKRKLKAGDVKREDVRRALIAARGDMKKAERLLDLMEKHKPPTYQKERLIEYGEANPQATPDEIWKETERPRVESSFMVRLREATREGLEKAAQKLAMDPREVAEQAINEWLRDRGYIVG